MADGYELVKEVRIKATPETIFSFFTDPEKIVGWKCAAADVDAVPGGKLRCDMTSTRTMSGEYVSLDPPSRLVYTFGWEGDTDVPPGASQVEVTLTADGDETLLRLVHSGLPTQESADAHGVGWDHYLQRLVIKASGGDPGPDEWMTN